MWIPAYGRRYMISLAVLVALVPAPPHASAEWFIDLYSGYSWTERSDVQVRGFDILGVPVDVELLNVDPDSSPLGGVRAGYWFGFAPELGLAMDAFYFRPDVRAQRVRARASVTAPTSLTGELFDEPVTLSATGPTRIPSAEIHAGVLSLEVMVRWRLLKAPEFPHGRVQPYLLVGPAALITDPEDFGVSIGFIAGAGVAWHLTRHLALFGEYRFTRFTPDVDSGNFRYEATVNTHHAVGGVSFRF